MRRVLVVAVIGLALAACGGGDEEASGDESTTSTTEEEVEETTTTTEEEDVDDTTTSTTEADDGPTTTVEVDPWLVTAVHLRGRGAELVDFECPPPAPATVPNVWGSNPYTDDSSICTAGVHAGVIDEEEGGTVTIEPLGEQDAYEGSTANGIETLDYGFWPNSFRVVEPG